jgi:hypothetical protein
MNHSIGSVSLRTLEQASWIHKLPNSIVCHGNISLQVFIEGIAKGFGPARSNLLNVVKRFETNRTIPMKIPWKADVSGSLPLAGGEDGEQKQRRGKWDEWNAEEHHGIAILDGDEQQKCSEEDELQ